MTLGLITPKGKVGGGEANGKTKVGPCCNTPYVTCLICIPTLAISGTKL